jgi:hypothetical protein
VNTGDEKTLTLNGDDEVDPAAFDATRTYCPESWMEREGMMKTLDCEFGMVWPFLVQA